MQPDLFGLNFGLGILNGFGQAGFGAFNTPKDAFRMAQPPTAQTKTHLGIASCLLLKDYTSTYPCLKEVGVLLKEFLSLHDLNSAYRGKYHRAGSSHVEFEFRRNQLVQCDPADRCVHEQLQTAVEPAHHAVAPPDGLPRLLLELFRPQHLRRQHSQRHVSLNQPFGH